MAHLISQLISHRFPKIKTNQNGPKIKSLKRSLYTVQRPNEVKAFPNLRLTTQIKSNTSATARPRCHTEIMHGLVWRGAGGNTWHGMLSFIPNLRF